MANADISAIWDVPAISSSSIRVETHGSRIVDPTAIDQDVDDEPAVTARKSKRPLFLESDEEDTGAATSAPSPSRRRNTAPDIDALFEDLEDQGDALQELAPALDLSALRREADARNARVVQKELADSFSTGMQESLKNKAKGRDVLGEDGEGEDDGKKKKRKPVARLDEARLLNRDGFPQLISDIKYFKPKGKGHEVEDLDRVMHIYQFWTHKMYPKTRFGDTVGRVEKLCHSKRMHVALSVWRDEAKGLVNGRKLPDTDGNAIDLTEDEEEHDRPRSVRSSRQSSFDNARQMPEAIAITSDVEMPSSRPPTAPPSSEDDFDFDVDALLLEEAEQALQTAPVETPPYRPASCNKEEDESMWDALESDMIDLAVPPQTKAIVEDEDEDMWDVVREMESEQAAPEKTTAHQPAISKSSSEPMSKDGQSTQEPYRATNDEGWDDMYI